MIKHELLLDEEIIFTVAMVPTLHCLTEHCHANQLQWKSIFRSTLTTLKLKRKSISITKLCSLAPNTKSITQICSLSQHLQCFLQGMWDFRIVGGRNTLQNKVSHYHNALLEKRPKSFLKYPTITRQSKFTKYKTKSASTMNKT